MVVAFQKRKNRDAPYVVRAFRPSATHHWLLTGKTLPAKYPTANPEKRDILDDQGMLQGTILIIPYQSFFETDLTAQFCKKDIAHILRANQTADHDAVENQLKARVDWMENEGLKRFG